MRTSEASEAMPSKTAYQPAAAPKPPSNPPAMAWLKGTATPKPPPMAWLKGTETPKPPSMAWLKGTTGPSGPTQQTIIRGSAGNALPAGTKPASFSGLWAWLQNAAQKINAALLPTPSGYTKLGGSMSDLWISPTGELVDTQTMNERLGIKSKPQSKYNFTPGSMAALLPYEYPNGIAINYSNPNKDMPMPHGPGAASNMSWDETPSLTDNTGGTGTGGYYDWWPYPSGDYGGYPYQAGIPSWLYGNIYWRGW